MTARLSSLKERVDMDAALFSPSPSNLT